MHKHKFTNPKNTAHSNKKPDAPATSSCQVARWAPYSDPLAGRLCQSPWPRIAPVGSHRSPESCLSLVRARIKSGKLGVIGRNNHLKAIENLGTLRFLPFSKAIFQINPKRMQLTQHGRNAKHPQCQRVPQSEAFIYQLEMVSKIAVYKYIYIYVHQ